MKKLQDAVDVQDKQKRDIKSLREVLARVYLAYKLHAVKSH